MTTTDGKPPLSDAHLADLRKSGLSDETIHKAGLYSLTDPAVIGRLLNWKGPARQLGACLAIPYVAPDGSPTGYTRLRPDNPRTHNGKPVKYESPLRAPSRVYFPPGTIAKLSDISVRLVITEGEKKALKADQEGLACLGLAGVSGWSVPRTNEEKEQKKRRVLRPDLQAINMAGREVVITFDSDAATKPDVRAEEQPLTAALHLAGAVAIVVRLPAAANGDKVGLDDYLIEHGVEKFLALVEDARAKLCGQESKGPCGWRLQVEAAARGRSQVSVFNGKLVHSDVLDLKSAMRRNQFVGAAAERDPDLDLDWIREQLLQASATCLPQAGGVTGVTVQTNVVPEPWPDPVNGAELLDEVVRFLKSYMVLPEHGENVLALWLLHTYLPDVGSGFTPYIWVSSPVRECGKSTLLELLSHLAYRGQMTGGITAAALYRRIHRAAPTMLLDELDTRLRGDGGEALRGVLNTGFYRSGKVTICVGDGHEDQDFNTFCPKVLAGIGRLWDTVMSRAVPIRLRRASKHELKGLKKIRGDRIEAECLPFRRKLLRLACDVRAALSVTETVTPDALSARQCDVWRPLLAIAAVTGGHWTVTAPKAAVAIHGAGVEEGDYGLLLLEDLRGLLAKQQTDALFSEFIVQELVKKEDRPWAEYRGDKPITKNGLASLLRRFEVHPQTVRIGGGTAKGYRAADLAPLFKLYLTDTPPQAEPSQPSQPPETGSVSPASDEPCDGCDGLSGGGGADVRPLGDEAEMVFEARKHLEWYT